MFREVCFPVTSSSPYGIWFAVETESCTRECGRDLQWRIVCCRDVQSTLIGGSEWLALSVMLAMEMSLLVLSSLQGRQWLIGDVSAVNHVVENNIAALKDLLICLQDPRPFQVTFLGKTDLPSPWSVALSSHAANLPVLLNLNHQSRGFVHVLPVLPSYVKPAQMALYCTTLQSTNPNATFVIVYLSAKNLQLKTLQDINREFFFQFGTTKVIHLCPNEALLYFAKGYDPLTNEWDIIGQSVTEFCSDQLNGLSGKLQLYTGYEILKGLRFGFIIREHNTWINSRGERMFGGREIEFAKLLMKYGLQWTQYRNKPTLAEFLERNKELELPMESLAYFWSPRKRLGSEEIDYTVVVGQNDDFLVVRRALQIPLELAMVFPFDWQTWSSIGALIVVFILGWSLVHSHCFRISAIISASFDLVETMLTGGSSRLSIWTSQRILLLCALFLHILAGSAYTGLLLSFLTYPPFYKELNTIRDAVAIADRLYVSYGYLNRRNIERFSNEQTVLIHIRNESERDGCIRDIVRTGKAATCMNEFIYSVTSRYRKYTEKGQVLLHKVKEPLLSPGYGVFPVRRNHLMLPVINNIILRLWQSGLLDYWDNKLAYSLDLDGQRVNTGMNEDPEKLKINQLSGPFLLYVVGLGLAVIAFVIEKILRRH